MDTNLRVMCSIARYSKTGTVAVLARAFGMSVGVQREVGTVVQSASICYIRVKWDLAS